MTSTRFLLPGVVLAVFAGDALAQFRSAPGSGSAGVVPSVLPAGGEAALSARPRVAPVQHLAPLPNERTPAAVAGLHEITAPGGPGGAPAADPVGTLTGLPAATVPPGSYPSPYHVDGPGCCGPLGMHGRVGYDLYTYAGANFVFGDGLPEKLGLGWTVGGGVRTLFFNPDHTAAWALDYGLSFTHNGGQNEKDPATLFIRQTPGDRVALSGVRGVYRTSFNFSVGRDVWLMGSGNTGGMQGTNCRVGGWVGGRYGTSHVDIIPLDEIDGYARRQNVFHGVFVGAHATADVPMGGWILFGGVRAEYGYDWTNLIPPLQGNIHNINVQLSLGIRY